ncbi:hypothetical protein NE237_011120 [Protea cynaroides]|uniref:Pectinesterase inhibitor domain-containing protein n=1 Tax=Protea cynaroides TaxID=273540 RepID=A0A9Q0GUD0_9MAGN|nr:hypothetical protein NE237_011120 [Protea cynaroides]
MKGIRYPPSCYALMAAIVSFLFASSNMKSCLATNYISSCCESTRYPILCYTLVTKLSQRENLMANEKSAINDCVTESLQQMKDLGGSNFEFKKSNLETWVSAALTDDNTCMDGLVGLNGKVEKSIRSSATTAERLTSNALAIINGLTSRP